MIFQLIMFSDFRMVHLKQTLHLISFLVSNLSRKMGKLGILIQLKILCVITDENNFLSFNTRRQRKIDFTEYYDLIYEYANDCITAGIKYKKTFYQDRDYKPTQDILFTLTIFPLTTYEKRFDR